MPHRTITLITLSIVSLLLGACVPLPPAASQPVATTAAALDSAPTAASQAPDYSQPERWLSLPESTELPVDVFYLYPTSFRKADASSPNIAAIDDPGMMAGAQAAFARQATAFDGVGNIFAPYYRQADAAFVLALPEAEQAEVIGDTPLADATAAFAYYLDRYNGGRPFILAGHSQGSNLLIYILSDYLKAHPDVYERMVAAYVIGYSVTGDYLARNPHLKFAEGPDDTGVIVSYNTEAPDVAEKNPVVLPGALAINPITWTRSEEQATAEQNLGSIVVRDGAFAFDADGKPEIVMDFADARVDLAKGVVICSTAPEDVLAPGNAVFPRGVYHSFDYPFYYLNIRENAANRVERYLAANP